MVMFDIVSAFPHAAEARDDVLMDPPPEWTRRHAADDVRLVLCMLQRLYGRRSAGANFDDKFDEVLRSKEEWLVTRGLTEPSVYRSALLT